MSDSTDPVPQQPRRKWWSGGNELTGGRVGCGPGWLLIALVVIVLLFWGYPVPGCGDWVGYGRRPAPPPAETGQPAPR